MGYVYKYTHKITGKWYIGSHIGTNPRYQGSGLIWRNAVKKYGIEAFNREILYEGPNYRKEEEKFLLLNQAASDVDSYNLKNEALGGSFCGERNGMYGKFLTAAERYRCGNAFRGKKRPLHSIKMLGRNNPAFGKTSHTVGLVLHAKNSLGKTIEEIHGKNAAAALRKKYSKMRRGKKLKLKIKQCPYCHKIGSGPNMTRYHFDACRSAPLK